MLPMLEAKLPFVIATHSSLPLIFNLSDVDVNLILRLLVLAPPKYCVLHRHYHLK